MIPARCARRSRSSAAHGIISAPMHDARNLFEALTASPARRDIKIGDATHLMHLERARFALYRETETFLAANDLA